MANHPANAHNTGTRQATRQGWWSWLFGRSTERKSGVTVLDLARWMSGSNSDSGVIVNNATALQCVVVYACIRVIAESVAQLPLHLYRRDGYSKERADDHPLYRLLHDQPNNWQTAFEFWEGMTGQCCLRGNAYAYISRSRGTAEVLELVPLYPDYMQVEQLPDMTLVYTYRAPNRPVRVFRQREIMHLRGLCSNGYLGMNPIEYARNAVGLAISTERHGGRVFRNGAYPCGVLTTTGALNNQEAIDRLREEFAELYGGDNVGRPAVLEEGMDWKSLSLSMEDSQFLQTRRYQKEEIASLFRVPLYKIMDYTHATFSNVEHLAIEFVTDTLLPWLRRFEQAIWRDLLPDDEKGEVFAEFLVDGLLRGDLVTRYQAYGQGINWGILSPNEARRRENLNPRENGDTYLQPVNMLPAGKGPVEV